MLNRKQGMNCMDKTPARVTARPGRILLHLANRSRECVSISRDGWKVTAEHQLARPRFAAPLPSPSAAGSLESLRGTLSLATPNDWLRCLAWLVSAIRPSGPFPMLVLRGPANSGKSVALYTLRSVVDPSPVPFLGPPSWVREVRATAGQNWVVAFDGISAFPPTVLDALCWLSSRLGLVARHSRSPAATRLSRPAIITVAPGWRCPATLRTSTLMVDCAPIPPGSIRKEAALKHCVDSGSVLAALCDAVAAALRGCDPSDTNPADWAVAAAAALGATPDEMRRALPTAAASDPLIGAAVSLLRGCPRWSGSASALLSLVGPFCGCTTPKGVSQRLRHQRLALAACGIDLRFRRLPGGARLLELVREGGDDEVANAPENASQNFTLVSEALSRWELTAE